MHALVLLAIVTSSFDVLLIFDLGGTVRLSQLLTILFIVAAISWIVQQKRVLWPRGGASLVLFMVFQAVLMLQWSGVVFVLSVQVFMLLLLSVLGIFAMLQLYGDSRYVEKLMRGYLLSFVAIAAFGMFQWVAPALHLGHPFIRQWIRYGILPRLNGLSYEPSYFATYMIMGFIMLVDLRVTRAKLTAGRRWFWATVLVSAVFFLSTSKTAWIFLLLEALLRLRPYFVRAVRIHVVRFRPRSSAALAAAGALCPFDAGADGGHGGGPVCGEQGGGAEYVFVGYRHCGHSGPLGERPDRARGRYVAGVSKPIRSSAWAWAGWRPALRTCAETMCSTLNRSASMPAFRCRSRCWRPAGWCRSGRFCGFSCELRWARPG